MDGSASDGKFEGGVPLVEGDEMDSGIQHAVSNFFWTREEEGDSYDPETKENETDKMIDRMVEAF